MDLDKAFVQAYLRGEQVARKLVLSRGVTSEYLSGEGRLVFEYIEEHTKAYKDWPSQEVLEAKLGIPLDETEGSFEFLLDEVMNRRLFHTMQKGAQSIVAKLEATDPRGAVETMEVLRKKILQDKLVQGGTVTLDSALEEAQDYYTKIKSGVRGIQTPWGTMNDLTLGMWPEDLVLVVARSSVGKTWFLIILAICAFLSGKRVLFATTEISRMMIGLRVLSYYNKFNYRLFRGGLLSMFEEEKMLQSLADLKGDKGFYLVGGDFDLRPDTLEAAIEETSPDLVCVDGAYRMQGEGTNRIDRAANAFDELKRLSKRGKLSLVASTQFNREVKATSKKKEMGMESIALASTAAWNADLAFGMFQDEEMRADKRMTIKPLKVREGVQQEFDIEWNLDEMSFRELKADVVKDDADFSSGVEALSSGVVTPPSDALPF